MGNPTHAAGTVLAIVAGSGEIATGGIDTIEINAGGSGYSEDDILTVVQTGGSSATFRVTGVNTGAVTELTRLTVGDGYSEADGLATTVAPSGGTGCKVNVTGLLHLICHQVRIDGPDGSVAMEETTSHDSESNGNTYAEFIPVVIDEGALNLDGFFTGDEAQTVLNDAKTTGAKYTYHVVYPAAIALTLAFEAYVAELASSAEVRAPLKLAGKLKVTGPATLAAIVTTV